MENYQDTKTYDLALMMLRCNEHFGFFLARYFQEEINNDKHIREYIIRNLEEKAND